MPLYGPPAPVVDANLWTTDPNHKAATFPAWQSRNNGVRSAAVVDGLPCMQVTTQGVLTLSGVELTNTHLIPVTAGQYYLVRITGKFPAGVAMRSTIECRDVSQTVVDSMIVNWNGSGDWEVVETWIYAPATTVALYDRVTSKAAPAQTFYISRGEVTLQNTWQLEGSFETANLTQLDVRAQDSTRVTLVSSDPTPRFGRYCARVELRNGDVGGGEGCRTELWASSLHIPEGEDIYAAWSWWFPEDLVIEDSSHFENIGQLVGLPDVTTIKMINRASPGFGWPGTGEVLEIGTSTGSPNHTWWQTPFPGRGEWIDLIVRLKLSQDPLVGFMEVWLNGESQVLSNGDTRLYLQTFDSDVGNYVTFTHGLYRSAAYVATQVAYIDGLRVTKSFAVASEGPSRVA